MRYENDLSNKNYFQSHKVLSIVHRTIAQVIAARKIIFRLSRYKQEKCNKLSSVLTSDGGRLATLLVNLDESLLHDFRDL